MKRLVGIIAFVLWATAAFAGQGINTGPGTSGPNGTASGGGGCSPGNTTAVLKGNNAGGCVAATLGTDYLAPGGDITYSSGNQVTNLSHVTNNSLPSTGLAATGVSAGSYTNTNLTVNAAGQITAAANGSSGASINNANQFQLPYYSASGSNNTLSGFTAFNGLQKDSTTGVPTQAVACTDYASATTGGANTPLFNNGSGCFTNGTRSGNTTQVMTGTGAFTTGDMAGFDVNHNIVDIGAPPNSNIETNLCSGSGTTSGSYQGYEEKNGHFVQVTIYLNNYFNSTGTPQNCSFTANGATGFVSSESITSNVSPFAATYGAGTPPGSINLPVNMTASVLGTLLIEGQ